MEVSRTSATAKNAPAKISAKTRLIDAAHGLIRRQGYAATSVDEICAVAGVTKGAFFHHFKSKEALAVAAAAQWTKRAAPMFERAELASMSDPLDRVLNHIDLRAAMLEGAPQDFSCFVGTLVQENFATSDAIRAACDSSISAYIDALTPDFQAAIDRHGIAPGITAQSLAAHVQAVLQGAFVLAKAKGSPSIARENVAHLKRYVEMLFGRKNS